MSTPAPADSAADLADDLADDLAFVVDLAKRAADVARGHFGRVERLTKTHAATTDEPVTIADRQTQQLIVSALRDRFPTDGLVGEESDTGESITFDVTDPAGRNWVIDPIDGTNNFIAGFGCFAVCIGLLRAGRPVLGVVYDVARDECYAGAEGLGATLNGRPVRAPQSPLDDASVLMLTSNLTQKDGSIPAWPRHFIGQTNWKVRILGSAALEAASVASGVAHAAVTVNGKLWDAAAPAAVVLAAGGTFTDLSGGPIWPFDLAGYQGAKVPFLAAGPAARDAMLKVIGENP